jgi:hypothetical protein
MLLFQKNLLSFLCIGSLLLYTTDGFISSFPAKLSSLNPTQIIKPVIESHRCESSIGRRRRLRAATKDSFKSSTTHSSGSSSKIQDMASLTSLDGDDDAIEGVTKNGKESSSSTRSGRKEWAATIQGRYAVAAKVSHSFITREFQPAWFATNRHFQTIIGALFRKQSMYSRSISVLLDLAGVTTSNKGSESLLLDHFTWDKRERMKTPDGDFFDVDWSLVNSKDDNNPVCLICHGLERYVCAYYLIPFFKHVVLFPFIVVLTINLLAFIYLSIHFSFKLFGF